jgi:tetrahydromethanopterin S-methyltransferase subunit G
MDDMSNDDPTRDLPDETDRSTQPTITAVFELVRELKQSVDAINVRLDATNARLDATNVRLDATNARLDATNARLDELFEMVKSGFMTLEDKIDRSTLHSEADYHDLRKRMRDLESKAS